MAQTVIGIFDSDPAAEEAVQHLLAVGVDREGVHIHTRPSEIEAMEHSSEDVDGTAGHGHESLLDKVERFFASLVGDDGHPPEFYHYREVVRRGGALVSVCVEDDAQLPIIFTIFETSGARDIDEHASRWKRDLQDDQGMTSRGVPEPGSAAGADKVTSSEPDVGRQVYRVYPGVPQAASSSLAGDAPSPQEGEQQTYGKS